MCAHDSSDDDDADIKFKYRDSEMKCFRQMVSSK